MWSNEYHPEKSGYQVLLSSYNEEDYVERCLISLDESLKNKDWILLFGDDGSTDRTLMELARYVDNKISADKVHLYEYDKAPTVGAAKNRLVKEAHNFKEDYQSILFMDTDDMMLPERAHMVDTAIKTNVPYVVGTWEKSNFPYQPKLMSSELIVNRLQFGPWATLFDCNVLPEDGCFFPESESCNTGYEDILTWYHLKYIKDMHPVVHKSAYGDEPVHTYSAREESASRTADVGVLNYKRNMFWGISELIKDHSRNIYEDPPSIEEAEEAMEKYITRKEYENASAKSENPQGSDCKTCGKQNI